MKRQIKKAVARPRVSRKKIHQRKHRAAPVEAQQDAYIRNYLLEPHPELQG
jgi:hypothetical protein